MSLCEGVCVFVYVCMHACMYVCVCMHACMCACVCVCVLGDGGSVGGVSGRELGEHSFAFTFFLTMWPLVFN